MPKKNSKKKDSAAEGKKGKKKGGRLIAIIIFVLILAAVSAVVVLDLFNVRTRYLVGFFSKAPVIGKYFTPAEGEEAAEITPEQKTSDLQATIEDLTAKLNSAEEALTSEKQKSDMYVKEIDRQNTEISQLREYESMQEAFRRDKEEFDRMIAEKDPNAYIQFYESISPENQINLYEDAVLSQQRKAELNNYVKTVESMDGSSAARMLEQLIIPDMEIVVLVLQNINVDTRAEILGSMSAENAATVYKQLAPEQ